jgi:hypothetical protein
MSGSTRKTGPNASSEYVAMILGISIPLIVICAGISLWRGCTKLGCNPASDGHVGEFFLAQDQLEIQLANDSFNPLSNIQFPQIATLKQTTELARDSVHDDEATPNKKRAFHHTQISAKRNSSRRMMCYTTLQLHSI